MECPNCKSTKIRVTNSKKKDYKTLNIRALECEDCLCTFQSVETVIEESVNVAVSNYLKKHQSKPVIGNSKKE